MSTDSPRRSHSVATVTTPTVARLSVPIADGEYIVLQIEGAPPSSHSTIQERVRDLLEWHENPTFRTLQSDLMAGISDVDSVCGGILGHSPNDNLWHCDECGVNLPPGVWVGHIETCRRSVLTQ